MTKNLVEQVEAQRHEVIVDTYTPTWSELIAQYKSGDVNVDPEYQRAFRWTLEQQTKYIESLLLNIPTPPIFLAEQDDGRFEVIDGLQRFSTIIKFFAEEIFEEETNKAAPSDENKNDIRSPTTLTEAPILTELKGLKRRELPETLVRTLRYARVQVILLQRESSRLAKYNVFTRLNRSGTTLSNQEIRNCSARLFNSDFPGQLMELAKLETIKSSLSLSPKEASSMGVQECILRLIAFGNYIPHTQKLEEFLDEVMYDASSGEFLFDSKQEEKIIQTFEVIHAACPKGEAFKFFKGKRFQGAFSSNLFDIIACGIYKNLSKNKKRTSKEIRLLIEAIHQEEKIKSLTGAGSNARSKMIGRVEFGKKWFS